MKTETIDNKDHILEMISREVKANMEEKALTEGADTEIGNEALLYIRF